MIRLLGATGIFLIATCVSLPAKEQSAVQAADTAAKPASVDAKFYDQSHIGPLDDGRVIVPTNQILSPAGRQLIMSGRPMDVALSPDRKCLAVLNTKEVQLVDVASEKILSSVPI